MTPETFLVLELNEHDGRISGSLSCGSGRALPLDELELGPEVTLELRDQPFTLAAILERLSAYDLDFLTQVFDERGQLELGSHLYRQTIGRLPSASAPPIESLVRLVVVTESEYLGRLPWVLLARQGVFLCTTGWAITFSHQRALGPDRELPPVPSLLIAAPEPRGLSATHADEHLQQLEEALAAAEPAWQRGQKIRVARTWEDFQHQLTSWQPDAIYFYGHGDGDFYSSWLVFEQGEERRSREVPVADLALALRQLDTPPLLIYLDSCQGNAGGLLGAGRQLGEVAPAVVSHRTLAVVPAARRQALRFWQAVLVEGLAPHRAMAELRGRLVELGLSLGDVRWTTATLHAHYRRWSAHPPRPSGVFKDPHWRFKVDRVRQFAFVHSQTDKMLRGEYPRSLIYLWYGCRGQGIAGFHQRLDLELRQRLVDVRLEKLCPEWPEAILDVHGAFRSMLLGALRLSRLDQIAPHLRSRLGRRGQKVLLYVTHTPLRHPYLFTPAQLRTYLEWWDHNVNPQLDEAGAFALLGISYEVSHPARFQDHCERHLGDLDLQHTGFEVLDEMEALALRDLRTFLKEHDLYDRLPADRRSELLRRILRDTRGDYERTVAELEDFITRGWRLPTSEASDDDF